MGLVKESLTFSLYAQVITTLIGFLGLIYKLRPRDQILGEILTLETIVQVIEFCFYYWFSYIYRQSVDRTDIAKYRYYDWVFTTPIMLLNTVVFFEYNNRENFLEPFQDELFQHESCNDTSLTVIGFLTDERNMWNVIWIGIYNFLMLLIGYLHEISVVDIWGSTIIGFIFLGLVFEKIYSEYATGSPDNMPLFWLMAVLWSLYGVAAALPPRYKNFMYNILDIFSKNFYGVYLVYIIYQIRVQ
jgi:hypothetical protein